MVRLPVARILATAAEPGGKVSRPAHRQRSQVAFGPVPARERCCLARVQRNARASVMTNADEKRFYSPRACDDHDRDGGATFRMRVARDGVEPPTP